MGAEKEQEPNEEQKPGEGDDGEPERLGGGRLPTKRPGVPPDQTVPPPERDDPPR